MDNQITDLEAELQQLSPSRPSAALVQKLEAALAETASPTAHQIRRRSPYQSATNWSSWKWSNWTVAAGLAVVMTLASWQDRDSSTSGSRIAGLDSATSSEILRPFRAARTLVESRAEGVIELPDGSPVERVRDYFIDTIEWRDGAGDAQLRWELPRESVRFVALTSY